MRQESGDRRCETEDKKQEHLEHLVKGEIFLNMSRWRNLLSAQIFGKMWRCGAKIKWRGAVVELCAVCGGAQNF